MDTSKPVRLMFRRWAEADLDRFLDLYGRPEVIRYLASMPEPVLDAARALEIITRWRETWSEPYGVWAALRSDGVIAGTVLLVQMTPSRGRESNGEVEVGWDLHPDSWGRGYATSMGRWALNRGFDAGTSEIYATVMPGNARSIAVCRRLGMEALGTSTNWEDVECEVFRLRRA